MIHYANGTSDGMSVSLSLRLLMDLLLIVNVAQSDEL